MTEIDINTVETYYDSILKEMHASGISGAEIMEKLTTRYTEERCLAGGKPFPTFLKPAFLNPSQMEMVKHTTNVIMRCLEKVSNLFFEGDAYHSLFELAPGEAELAAIRPGYPNKVQHARLDAFMDGDHLQFCEFNCDTPGGPGYSDIQVRLLMDTWPMKEFTKKYTIVTDNFMQNVLNSLLDCYSYYGWATEEKPRILIHTLFDLDPTLEELYVLQKYFVSQGYETVVAQPQDCVYENGKLIVEGKPVRLVYRRGATQWWLSYKDKYSHLLEAYRDGAICMANPLNSKLAGKKSLMAVLQSPGMQKQLTEEEREIVRKHIPWTRLVEDTETEYHGEKIKLLDFIRDNKDNLVMKPIGLYGGKNVSIGRDITREEWNTAIETARKERYVVQEYIDIPEISLPVFTDSGVTFVSKKINMNFFAFNGKYAGGMARVSDSSIINISAGGGLVPILLVTT